MGDAVVDSFLEDLASLFQPASSPLQQGQRLHEHVTH